MVAETVLVFLNILFIELILSVDNASVLAIVVNKNLTNEKERKRSLQYGIVGAYLFRGLSLLLVGWLLYNPQVGAWFKIIGGLFLCKLFYTHMTPEADSLEEGETTWIERVMSKYKISAFWKTVIIVECLDIAFSVDNIVACVSLSDNMYIICGAVFLGILGMRFVAGYFSKLLTKYPSLENSAFIVILLLGIKMALAGVFDFFPKTKVHEILNAEHTDMIFSLLTIIVFAFPIIKSKFTKN